MKSKLVNQNLTKHIKIDAGLHQLLKIEAAKRQTTIKDLLEGYIADVLKDETSKST